METYTLTLTVLVALFLGVMGIIAMMEHRRRTELAHFEQLQQILSTCAQSLNGIHTNNYAQLSLLIEAVNQFRSEAQSGSNAAHKASENLRGEIVVALEHSAARLDESLQSACQKQAADIVRAVEEAARQLQKANEAAAKYQVAELHGATHAGSSQLTEEMRNATRAVEALKASLEESVKF